MFEKWPTLFQIGETSLIGLIFDTYVTFPIFCAVLLQIVSIWSQIVKSGTKIFCDAFLHDQTEELAWYHVSIPFISVRQPILAIPLPLSCYHVKIRLESESHMLSRLFKKYHFLAIDSYVT